MELSWDSGKIKTSQESWEISDILSIKFDLRFDRSSIVTFSIKKPKSHTDLLTAFVIFLGKVSLICLAVVLVAQFSILLSFIFGLFFLKLILPHYWHIYCECHKKGIRSFEFSDAVEFVKFEKEVWANDRGKRLIRHGFVMGLGSEEVFYVFIPAKIYNSDRFRHYLRVLTQVIYPVVVIIIPLFFGFCSMLAKNSKFAYKALKKDKLVKVILFIADESAEFIEDQANEYTFTRKLWRFLEKMFDHLEDLIEISSKWLRMEVMLIFMQIEYFNHCYVSVMRTFMKTLRFWMGFLKRHGFSWLITPLERGAKKISRAVDIDSVQELHTTGEKLKDEISGIQSFTKKYN